MKQFNKKEIIKTIQSKRVTVSKDVMCECLNKTVQQYSYINKVSEDVTKNPAIMTDLSEMTKYISAENSPYAKGKKFEYLNMSALLSNSLNSNYITMTKNSHDKGVDAIFETKNNTVFMQMKYRTKAKIGATDAALMIGYTQIAKTHYLHAEAHTLNTDDVKFVFITNAKLTKGAMAMLNGAHWTVVNNDSICDFLANPMKSLQFN